MDFVAGRNLLMLDVPCPENNVHDKLDEEHGPVRGLAVGSD
jgi:hypothetical protein